MEKENQDLLEHQFWAAHERIKIKPLPSPLRLYQKPKREFTPLFVMEEA